MPEPTKAELLVELHMIKRMLLHHLGYKTDIPFRAQPKKPKDYYPGEIGSDIDEYVPAPCNKKISLWCCKNYCPEIQGKRENWTECKHHKKLS